MSGKRPGGAGGIGAIMSKKSKMDGKMAAHASANAGVPSNPYLAHPVVPEIELQKFLTQVRQAARRYLPNELHSKAVTTPFCEVEARLGILKVPHAVPDRRVTSTGAKTFRGKPAHAFDCSSKNCSMLSGVSRSQFVKQTTASEVSPLTQALGVTTPDKLKRDLVETELVETVYTGYANDGRVCFDGEHPPLTNGVITTAAAASVGKMESKEKLMTRDLTIPAANFDLRISLSSEKIMNNAVPEPPMGWKSKRVKRRRSYTRRDKTIAWQIDVTEVTTTTSSNNHTEVDYEIEMELLPHVLLELINEHDPAKLQKTTKDLAAQLWWIMTQINPLKDSLDVEESIRDHPNHKAVQVALAQCGAFKRYMDSGCSQYDSPIGKSTPPSPALANVKFVGCMPVNFSRHNIEEIQRSAANDYYLSEKTDGVRYFLIFTGDTAVLVDRAMRGKQPIPIGKDNSAADPFAPILSLIKPGTVFDGEVVMNRRSGRNAKPRPVFIVFDVLALSTTEPILHLPFEQRLRHLRQASFRTPTAQRDMFDARFVADMSIALPLVRKNFVKRTDLDDLLSHVHEERGMRCYRNGELHNHLTDGVIFQPNRPYVCGTDVHLLKWKYLDTVTIDVEMLQLRHNDEDDTLRVGCLGEEQTHVDMTRYIMLPNSERARLEADKFEAGGRIVEVGFDPETGQWYYLTMRGDKVAPNHISTVLGSLLELAESLTTDELRYRMSVPAGQRDMFRKDMRGMLNQMLKFQRGRLQAAAGGGSSARPAAAASSSNGHHHR